MICRFTEQVFGLYVTEDIYTNIVYDAVSGKWIIRDVPVVTVSAGTFIKACVTGIDGKGIFAGELPLGKYEIKELTHRRQDICLRKKLYWWMLLMTDHVVDSLYGYRGMWEAFIMKDQTSPHQYRRTPKPGGSKRTHREEEIPVVPQPAPVESPTTGDSAPLFLLGFAGILALLGLGMIGSVERRRRRTK